MGVRENECQISPELWKNRKIRKISCVFSQAPKRNFFEVTTDDLLHL